jgi:hypothetical protein
MSPGRMVATLPAVLACGAVVAVLVNPDAEAMFAPFAFVLSSIAALAIAAVLLMPVVVVRALTGIRPAWPSGRALATALVAGGLVTFPVYSHFYADASLAAVGSGVGSCNGILPLAQVVRNSVADEPYGEFYYFASCDD